MELRSYLVNLDDLRILLTPKLISGISTALTFRAE